MRATEEGTAWKQIGKADSFRSFLICPLKDLEGGARCRNHRHKSGSDYFWIQSYWVLTLLCSLSAVINTLNDEWQLLTAANYNFSLTIQTATSTKISWIHLFSYYETIFHPDVGIFSLPL